MVISITHSLEFENPLRGTVEYVDMYILRSYKALDWPVERKERKEIFDAIAAWQCYNSIVLAVHATNSSISSSTEEVNKVENFKY